MGIMFDWSYKDVGEEMLGHPFAADVGQHKDVVMVPRSSEFPNDFDFLFAGIWVSVTNLDFLDQRHC